MRGPKSARVEGEHELFGFLTTEANAVVAPIQEKAMPVILTTPAEVDRWLGVETPDALEPQQPLPVARGERTDGVSPGRAGMTFDDVKRLLQIATANGGTGQVNGPCLSTPIGVVSAHTSHSFHNLLGGPRIHLGAASDPADDSTSSITIFISP